MKRRACSQDAGITKQKLRQVTLDRYNVNISTEYEKGSLRKQPRLSKVEEVIEMKSPDRSPTVSVIVDPEQENHDKRATTRRQSKTKVTIQELPSNPNPNEERKKCRSKPKAEIVVQELLSSADSDEEIEKCQKGDDSLNKENEVISVSDSSNSEEEMEKQTCSTEDSNVEDEHVSNGVSKSPTREIEVTVEDDSLTTSTQQTSVEDRKRILEDQEEIIIQVNDITEEAEQGEIGNARENQEQIEEQPILNNVKDAQSLEVHSDRHVSSAESSQSQSVEVSDNGCPAGEQLMSMAPAANLVAIDSDKHTPVYNTKIEGFTDPVQKSEVLPTVVETENLDAVQLATELVQTYGGKSNIKIPPLEMLTNSGVAAEIPPYQYQSYPELPAPMSTSTPAQYIPYQQQVQVPIGSSDRQPFQSVMNQNSSRAKYDEYGVDKGNLQYHPPQQYNMYSGNYPAYEESPTQHIHHQDRFRRNLSATFSSPIAPQVPAGYHDRQSHSNPPSWNMPQNHDARRDYPVVQPPAAYQRHASNPYYRNHGNIPRDGVYAPDVKMTTRAGHLDPNYVSPCPPQRSVNNPNFQNLQVFSDIDYSSIYPSRDFIEKSTTGAYMTPTNSAQKCTHQQPSSYNHSSSSSLKKSSYCESPTKDGNSSFTENPVYPELGPGQKYFVVNPSDTTSMEPKHLLAKYIDFLILENEQRTEISKSMSVPVDIYVTEDMYFMDNLKSKVPFPTSKFTDWVKSFFPKLNLNELKFLSLQKEHASASNKENPVVEDDRSTQQVLEDIFYFFQRKMMNVH